MNSVDTSAHETVVFSHETKRLLSDQIWNQQGSHDLTAIVTRCATANNNFKALNLALGSRCDKIVKAKTDTL